LLDPVVTAYVEEDRSVEQIVGMGFAEEIVKRTARLCGFLALFFKLLP